MNDDLTEAIPPVTATRAFLEALDAIGPRLMGSELEFEALSFVDGYFRGLGFDSFTHEFHVPCYVRGETECALVHAGKRHILAAMAVERCPATEGVFDLSVVPVGGGGKAEVEAVADRLSGKAAFPSKPGGDGFTVAARAEAAAWIEPCSAAFDEIRLAYMPPGSEGLSCPRIKMKASSGLLVRESLESGDGVRVELRVEGVVKEGRAANLEVTIPGATDLPQVLVGAHMDTFSFATGATDNGTGITAACMVARALSRMPKPVRGIRFIFFTGEEDDKRGSKEYVASRLPSTPPAGVYVNFDVPHGGVPLLHVMAGEDCDWSWFEGLKSKHGDDLAFGRNMRRSSDHYSFYRAGIPCIMPRAVPRNDDEDPGLIIHTVLDTMERVDFTGLQRSINLSTRLLYELANARQLPFGPFEPLPDEASNFPDPG